MTSEVNSFLGFSSFSEMMSGTVFGTEIAHASMCIIEFGVPCSLELSGGHGYECLCGTAGGDVFDAPWGEIFELVCGDISELVNAY